MTTEFDTLWDRYSAEMRLKDSWPDVKTAARYWFEAGRKSRDGEVAALREALSSVQWDAELGFAEDLGCGVCGHHSYGQDMGHAPDCSIGQALSSTSDATRAFEARVRAEERERCAQVVLRSVGNCRAPNELAAAIRALGEKPHNPSCNSRKGKDCNCRDDQ